MTHPDSSPNRDISDELGALRAIVEETARHTGQEFFQSLVRHLAAAVGTRYAFVAEFAGGTMARTLAFWFRDHIADNIEWDVTGTPCEDVVRGNLCHHPAGVSQQFPADRLLVDWGIESYLGVPLCDARGRHLGHLAVLGERPMPAEPHKLITFRIFAARAAAELERLHYEERLRESEQRWRGLTEALPQLVWSATPDGACDYFSTQWTEHTGVPETDLLGWRWLATLHPDDREPTRRLWTDSVAGRGPYDVEYRVRRSDGVYRWFKTRGTPIRDSEGNIAKWFGTCTDITDLLQIEEALRASEERFRGTFENAAVGIAHRDATGRVLRVNEKLCAIVGYSREELLQKTVRDLTHPDDLAASIDALTALWQGESPILRLEKRYVRKDGSLVWGELFASLQRDAAGKPAYDISIVNDISERKRLEEELRASEERQRLILDNAHDAFVAMSADGLITEWNHQAEITFGWPRGEAVGRVLSETIIPPQFREAHQRGLARFLATGEGPLLNRVLEVPALRRDGREFPAEIGIAPVRVGEQCLFAAFIRDVTERKRAEEELRRAKDTAEAANRAKDEFLANVSHEIRTPMNAILGMTELVLDTLLADDQRQCLKTVKSAADNLLGILNDLLDFAKIEAGKLELDPADFSLRAAVGDTLQALAMRAHKKGLELIYHVKPDVPDALVGDASRLRQVLLNLVGNAIKFTEEGEVVVRVEAAADPAPEDQVGLRFVVSDTGIGISPERQERIFGAFEQEDTSTTRRYGGTGLGLTIAARLVALMGGTITVDSRPGRGSTFCFTARFGRQPPGSEPVAARPPAQLRDLRVLIVDDNATNRRILEEWLRSWRMEPAAVGDGLAALNALWRALSLGRPYALVLLDARMPDTDGLALAAQLRAQTELAATPIILLTSGDRPGDLVRSRELRVESHLFKPVPQEELLEAIYRVMSRAEGEAVAARPAPAQESTPAPAPAAAPLRILVAEDNEFNKEHLEGLLARRGHTVRLADNGREALALIGIRGQGSGATLSPTPGPFPQTPDPHPGPLTPAFDLLLLDLQMPELDGFQVVRAIRERERVTGGHLPVIALTARSRNEDRQRCLVAGMDEYLAKPVRSAELFAVIERVVSSPGVPHFIRPDPGEATHLLDPVVLLAACGDEAEGLCRMCQGLRSHLPGRLAEVGEALRTRDAPRLRGAAHKLCGLLSAFSTVAGGVASDLEDQAAGGRLEECRPLVKQLEAMARELIEQVDGLSIEVLRDQAGAAGDRNRTASPW